MVRLLLWARTYWLYIISQALVKCRGYNIDCYNILILKFAFMKSKFVVYINMIITRDAAVRLERSHRLRVCRVFLLCKLYRLFSVPS